MTADGVTVRALSLSDIDAVGELVRQSFDASLTPYMVATQPGWPLFLALAVEHPASFPTHRLAVAERAGRVVAFADYRRPAPGEGFLSYICVAEEARGSGIGRALFAESVRRHGSVDSVGLDVFADNAPALALYRSLGFEEDSRQQWWRAPVPEPSRPLAVDGLSASLASLDRYGFCEVVGQRGDRRFRYGRMGRGVLRAFSAADYHDIDLTAALVGTFPELRETFTVLPAGTVASLPGSEAFNTSVRMSAHQFLS